MACRLTSDISTKDFHQYIHIIGTIGTFVKLWFNLLLFCGCLHLQVKLWSCIYFHSFVFCVLCFMICVLCFVLYPGIIGQAVCTFHRGISSLAENFFLHRYPSDRSAFNTFTFSFISLSLFLSHLFAPVFSLIFIASIRPSYKMQ